jgi:hypothetical protein
MSSSRVNFTSCRSKACGLSTTRRSSGCQCRTSGRNGKVQGRHVQPFRTPFRFLLASWRGCPVLLNSTIDRFEKIGQEALLNQGHAAQGSGGILRAFQPKHHAAPYQTRLFVPVSEAALILAQFLLRCQQTEFTLNFR